MGNAWKLYPRVYPSPLLVLHPAAMQRFGMVRNSLYNSFLQVIICVYAVSCHATDGPLINAPAGPSTANFAAINGPAGPSMSNLGRL